MLHPLLRISFEALDATAFRTARSAANPYEALGRAQFLNRSALKLVNMDHLFRWTTAIRHDELTTPATAAFAFADICGGPGGFSEYLLWRAAHRPNVGAVRGYGISLRDTNGTCDWKLPALSPLDVTEAARSQLSVSFEISYGADGTGDLYTLANVHHFRDVVRTAHPLGVDLVVADGGFQDARDVDNQERVMTRLVLAETLTMFTILKAGGSFVCKTFELATPAMLQLVWLVHQCFDKIAVIKPIVSG